MRYTLFCEAFHCITKIDNLIITIINGKMAVRYKHFGEQLPNFVNSMRTWGKAGVVTLKTRSTPIISDWGTVCIFVGYFGMHAGDCYRMFNPKIKGYIQLGMSNG